MASPTTPLEDYRKVAEKTKILMVGAGGIGCELLKNLVLAGFHDIVIIDLDTIDVTNLNRQFLFHRQHVGKSKAAVARESALSFNPDAKIQAIHGSITTSEYGVSFYEQFDLVLNALDNRAARSHVNRMCLAANRPLVESGTAGYLGQVTVMRKGVTECYDCQPKPHQKTFPGCTIRNTPSEPIHCIVWAKHLFNQLFGESDPDEDVSPDAEDPEATGDDKDKDKDTDAEAASEEKKASDDGNVQRVSTRQWAQECDYDAKSLFEKFFREDIEYLLTMDKLWAKRKKPEPVVWDDVMQKSGAEGHEAAGIKDQEIWSVKECAQVFERSLGVLRDNFKNLEKEDDHLVWDKDDDAAMDFVTACANVRMRVYHLAQKSRFDVKSMAGNIIPAIATTNAVIAGCIVMEAIKIITGRFDCCRTVYLTRKPNPRKKVLVPCQLNPPNPKCYVCAARPEVRVRLNVDKLSLRHLEDRILKGELNMIKPDVEVEGKGVCVISSEDGDMTDAQYEKTLGQLGVADGTILMCDDFLQKYTVYLIVFHADHLDDDAEFEIVGEVPTSQEEEKGEEKNGNGNGSAAADSNGSNGNGAAKEKEAAQVDDDDIVEIDADPSPKKRKLDAGDAAAEPASKKAKPAAPAPAEADDDIVCID